MSVSSAGLNFQHEGEYAPMCTDRARNGYNSGMGEMCAHARARRTARRDPSRRLQHAYASGPHGLSALAAAQLPASRGHLPSRHPGRRGAAGGSV
eukprot:3309826-Prymnesium_polylepis.1